jgi:hypothetical protein
MLVLPLLCLLSFTLLSLCLLRLTPVCSVCLLGLTSLSLGLTSLSLGLTSLSLGLTSLSLDPLRLVHCYWHPRAWCRCSWWLLYLCVLRLILCLLRESSELVGQLRNAVLPLVTLSLGCMHLELCRGQLVP